MNRADTFTGAGVLAGSKATEADCSDPGTSVWVTVDGQGDCIRYFHGGLADENKVVVIFLHGDRMAAARRADRTGVPLSSPGRLTALAARISDGYGLPYIWLSRPGTYGSSGDHSQRRRPRNVRLVNAAFDAIRKKYRIGKFVITGQSGGGHLTGALLAMRHDILCAVPTSGVLAVWQRVLIRNRLVDFTGYGDSYDPIKHVREIVGDPERRVFVIGDPNDFNVPFETQRAYYKALKHAGHNAWLLEAKGHGASRHGLAYIGTPVAFACAARMKTEDILTNFRSFRSDPAGKWPAAVREELRRQAARSRV